MRSFTIFLLSVVLIKSVFNLFTTIVNLRWLNTSKSTNSKPFQQTDLPDLFFLLPAYREQSLIEHAIEYYHNLIKEYPTIKLVIITTEKEASRTDKPSTYEITKKKLNSIEHKNQILLMHYPKSDGGMADQLNYAIEQLSLKSSDHWYFTLNIDSIIEEETLIEILNRITGDQKVYQYSAIFLSNFHKFNSPFSFILKGNALFQSRWTITHELKRFRWNTANLPKIRKFQLAHTVGHGLLIPASIISRYQFPSDQMIEDSPLGFILKNQQYTITPSKHLELGDSPSDIIDLYKQKYVWSFGPLDYLQYLSNYKIRFRDDYKQNKIQAHVLTAQGLLSALNWQLSSWVLLWILIYSIFIPSTLSIFGVFIFILYTLDYLICGVFFINKSYIKRSPTDFFFTYLGLILILLTHSFPANLALFDKIRSKLGLKEITKFKTNHE